MFDLTGRVALVTGAGQNQGAGIARTLAAQGAAVAVNDLRAERAERVAEEIRKAGGRALAVPFDVADFAAVTSALERAGSALGAVDVLVNNAGIPEGMGMAQFRDTQPAEWRPYLDVNVYGVMNCVRAVLDGMCARRFGRIITISSGAGRRGSRSASRPTRRARAGRSRSCATSRSRTRASASPRTRSRSG